MGNETTMSSASLEEQKLTEKRLKKRELDRRAQRTARVKTKNRLAYLEGLVAAFSENDSSETASKLAKQLEEALEERDKLKKFLETIGDSIRTHLGDPARPNTDSQRPRNRSSSLAHKAHSEHGAPTLPTVSAPSPAISMNTTDASHANIQRGWNTIPDQGYVSCVSPVSLTSCNCASPRTRRLSDGTMVNFNTWRAANEIMTILDTPEEAVDERRTTTGEDFLVRLILGGWEHVAQNFHVTWAWNKVRLLDEICFNACSETERLAILWLLHVVLRFRQDPSPANASALPDWCQKTPTQGLHSHCVDYIAWPAVRERFMASEHNYCKNLFWDRFRDHIRIIWPFEFTDCYFYDMDKGQYSLSKTFKETLFDIRNWTMEHEFFTYFPELYPDIPLFPGIPLDNSLPVDSDLSSSSLAFGAVDNTGSFRSVLCTDTFVV